MFLITAKKQKVGRGVQRRDVIKKAKNGGGWQDEDGFCHGSLVHTSGHHQSLRSPESGGDLVLYPSVSGMSLNSLVIYQRNSVGVCWGKGEG